MRKELLLAKSNFKKKKGISIGVGILMLISSLLILISLLLFLDTYPNTRRYAKKLNAGDGYSIVYNGDDTISNKEITDIIKDNIEEFSIYNGVYMTAKSCKYQGGDITADMLVVSKECLNVKVNRTEIVKEDDKYTSSYIYLPYKFHSAGNYQIGDEFILKCMDKDYQLKVRGFFNNTYFGDFNAGPIQFVLDDTTYSEINSGINSIYHARVLAYNTKDDINIHKLSLKLENELQIIDQNILCTSGDIESTISNRGFMSLIIAVSFLTVTAILSLVLALMLANSIANYIKENMKEIGALKAIGYRSRQIVSSILIQFVGIALVGSVLGIALGYGLMPVISKMVTSQAGFPYNVRFHFLSTIIPFVYIILFTFFIVILSTLKIKKIEPIVALRDGMKNHNFKKNVAPLDKSKLGLNANLATKTLCNNFKQGVITSIVTGFLVFVCTLALLMFENFNRHPKLDILTFETCSGVVAVDQESRDEAYEYITHRSDVHNVRRMINIAITYGDNDDSLLGYIIDDPAKLNNKNVCYKGKLPKYDNEVAISGKFASYYHYKVGDEIRFTRSDKEATYLISGLIQTCNNGGRELVMSEKAASRLMDVDSFPGYFWFDSNKDDVKTVIDDFKDKYGEHFVSYIDFNATIEGAMTGFKTIASLMLVVISFISGIIILLVLYLLIKTLLHNKRREYGILKALGYKDRSLILQTALSFMPPIIISSIIFSFISYFLANPYMSMIMINFGLMKCSFKIPFGGMVIISISISLISFLFALLESRKIKKVEPYTLLTNE